MTVFDGDYNYMFNHFLEMFVALVAVGATAIWCFLDPSAESYCTFTIALASVVGAAFHWGYTLAARVIRLRIVIDNGPDCLPISNKDWGGGAKRRRYVRRKLYNDSHNIAEDTCVKIMTVVERRVRGERSLAYANPQFLRWNGEGRPYSYAKKRMPNGGPQFVDLLYTEVNGEQFIVSLTDESYTPIGLLPGRTYRFVVQATAERAKAATKQFYVTLGYSYDDIIISRFWWMADFITKWLVFQRRE